jgi:hypothetical protein
VLPTHVQVRWRASTGLPHVTCVHAPIVLHRHAYVTHCGTTHGVGAGCMHPCALFW